MQFSVYFLIVIIFIGVFEVESNGVKECESMLNDSLQHLIRISDSTVQKIHKYQNYMYYLQKKPEVFGLNKVTFLPTASYFYRYFYYLGEKVNYENIHNPVMFCRLYINWDGTFRKVNEEMYNHYDPISENSVASKRLIDCLQQYRLIPRNEIDANAVNYYSILDNNSITDDVLRKRVVCVDTIFKDLGVYHDFSEKDIFESLYYRRYNKIYDGNKLNSRNLPVSEIYVAYVQYRVILHQDTKDISGWCKEEDFKEKTGLNDIKYKVTKEANEEDTSQRDSFFYDFMGINSTNDINASSSSFVINDSSEYENFNED